MTEGEERAVFAEKAMKTRDKIAKISSEDKVPEIRLAYMLADLMHWAEYHRLSFVEALDRAAVRYEEER